MALARWIPPVGVGVLAAVGTAYTGIADPNSSDAFPLCPLKAATGWDCPACGCLRAVHSLCRLDIAGAMDHNLLFVLALPFIVGAYALWLGRSLGWRLPTVSLPRQLFPALVALAMAFAVVRNLPIPGHDFLGSGIG
jgi:Protein of unknown function (DUF2752)